MKNIQLFLLSVYLCSYAFGLLICPDSGTLFSKMNMTPSEHTTSCPMDVNDHLQQWQAKYTAIEVSNFVNILSWILFGLMIVVSIPNLASRIKDSFIDPDARAGPTVFRHTYILQAFSDGRLQPKLFN